MTEKSHEICKWLVFGVLPNIDHFHFMEYNCVPLKSSIFLGFYLTGDLPNGNNKSVDP
ncbi:MAG: hypothetical protein RR633_07195 [Acinetobacter sp.]